MKGISVEELEEAALGFDSQNREYACVVRSLIAECKELDPWLTVDENTPRDRNLVLYTIEADEGYRQWIGRIRPDMRCPPTHYKLLLEDPK